MSKIPFYDAKGNWLGTASKKDIHDNGRFHRSVLILVVIATEVLVVTRGWFQSHCGKRDLLGGHEDEGDRSSLEKTARRELREELVATPTHLMNTKNLRKLGTLTSQSPKNRETSRVYGLQVPTYFSLTARDEDADGVTHELETKLHSLDDLRTRYSDDPGFAADGLSRVLAAMNTDLDFEREVVSFVTHGTSEWNVFFACTAPGEPGCGCPDGDFLGEHSISGSFAEADKEAKDLYYRRYHGDFGYWIEPADWA